MTFMVAGAVLYALWLLFILSMSFKRAWPYMHPVAKVLAAPVLIVGAVVDAMVNVLASLVFFDPPRELTLSHRLKRYNTDFADDWRAAIADWVCTHMLDQFDPDGDHC